MRGKAVRLFESPEQGLQPGAHVFIAIFPAAQHVEIWRHRFQQRWWEELAQFQELAPGLSDGPGCPGSGGTLGGNLGLELGLVGIESGGGLPGLGQFLIEERQLLAVDLEQLGHRRLARLPTLCFFGKQALGLDPLGNGFPEDSDRSPVGGLSGRWGRRLRREEPRS